MGTMGIIPLSYGYIRCVWKIFLLVLKIIFLLFHDFICIFRHFYGDMQISLRRNNISS